MNTPATSPLRYVLSSTALTVQASLRLAVVPDERGGHLEPEVVLALASRGRPIPVLSAVPVPLVVDGPVWAEAGSLRRAFDRAHPRTAALAADLSARAEQYLAGLRMGENVNEVVAFGRALEVVHRELAAADRMRREWIAAQSREVRGSTWDLSPEDLVQVPVTARSLPAGQPLPSEVATALADEYGVLVAVPETDPRAGTTFGSALTVFRRPPAALPDGAVAAGKQDWQRDDRFAHLHLVDDSGSAQAAPQPRLPQPRLGEADGPADPGWLTERQPEALLAARTLARTQLELLQGSDEYARLAATHARAEELRTLEHETRLADGLIRRF